MSWRRYSAYSEPAVSGTSGLLLPANPHRRFLEVGNGSQFNVYIAFGIPATRAQSVAILQSNRAERFYWRDVGTLITNQINAICNIGQSCQAVTLEGLSRHDDAAQGGIDVGPKPRYAKYSEVVIATTSTLLVSADAHRRFLQVSNSTSNTVFIAFGRTAISTVSFPLFQSDRAEKFRYEDIGPIITGDIYAITPGGNSGSIPVIEAFEPITETSTLGKTEAPFGMS